MAPSQEYQFSKNSRFFNPTARAPLYSTPSVQQLSENLDRGPPMEGESPSRRGVVKSRRSGSFYGSLGDYPGISTGPRSRLGDAEDEEGE
ncbi:hypothetical protein O181_034842 [Austropuccinia psidii MF-1]|uniref:Uncharacterized protein n=1 Tax=Austropuccinia psidii MF-1 TaxID=1389203 RepID=A0A9Q3D434_9BASI|nr:hypothetical protein [Austropuccinia psidii MF-1]